jgi:O-antigen/teichoic acid export membrane protein
MGEEASHAIGDAENLEDQVRGSNERSRNITRGVTSLTFQNLGTSILGFLFLALLLRFLPAIQYGIYSAITVSTSIGGAAASLGLQFAAARYLSISNGKIGTRAAARKIVLLGALFSGAAAAAFVLFSPYLSLYFAKSESWAWVFDLGALWLFSSSLSSVLQGAVQGLKKYTSLATMLFVSRVVMVALTVAGLFLVRSVSVAVLAWVAYSFLVVGWAALVVLRDLGQRSGTDDYYSKKISGFSLEYRDILRYAVPLGIASILSVVTSEADVVVVGGYLSPVLLGVYNNAVTIAGVLTIVLITPLITALLPEASSSAHDRAEVSNGLRLAIRFVMLAVLPASLLIAALSRQLIILFSGGGQGYLAGAGSLEVISAFYAFVGIQTVIYCLLQAMGKTIQALSICAVTTITDFAVAIVLVPSYGILGAAIARDIAAAIGMFAALYVGREYIESRLDTVGFYLKATIVSAAPFVLVWILSNYFSWRLLTIVPYTAVGGVTFVLCLRALHVLNREDKTFFAHALPSFARKILRPMFARE